MPIILLFVFGGILVVLLLMLNSEIKKQKSQRPKNGRQLQRLAAQSRIDHPGKTESWHWRNAQQKMNHVPASSPVNGAIKQKLFSLTGDWDASDRLVKQVMIRNPEKTEQWAYEKAIWDLERDRH